MFGCIEGVRAKALCSVIQCSAVLRGSLFDVCHCSKLRFVNLILIKTIIIINNNVMKYTSKSR